MKQLIRVELSHWLKEIETKEGDELAFFLTQAIRAAVRMEKLCYFILGYLLSMAKAKWEEFSFDFRTAWGDDFYSFACEVTGKDRSTIDNYINIWDTWFSGRYPIPENIKPEQIHHSKLLLVTGKFKREGLPENVWDALANPQITWRELRRELLGSTEEIHQEKINFRLEEDLLIAYAKGQRAEVARFFTPETELEKKAFLEIKRRLNLKEL